MSLRPTLDTANDAFLPLQDNNSFTNLRNTSAHMPSDSDGSTDDVCTNNVCSRFSSPTETSLSEQGSLERSLRSGRTCPSPSPSTTHSHSSLEDRSGFSFKLQLGNSHEEHSIANQDRVASPEERSPTIPTERMTHSVPRRRGAKRIGKEKKRSHSAKRFNTPSNADKVTSIDYLHSCSSSPPPVDEAGIAHILSTTNSVTCCMCGQPSGVCPGLMAHISMKIPENDANESKTSQGQDRSVEKQHPCDVSQEGAFLCAPISLSSLYGRQEGSMTMDECNTTDDRTASMEVDDEDERLTICLLRELEEAVDKIDAGLAEALQDVYPDPPGVARDEDQAEWRQTLVPRCRHGHSGTKRWCDPVDSYWYDTCGDANCEPCMDAFFLGTTEQPSRDIPNLPTVEEMDATSESQWACQDGAKETVATLSMSPKKERERMTSFTVKLQAVRKRSILAQKSTNVAVTNSFDAPSSTSSESTQKPARKRVQPNRELCSPPRPLSLSSSSPLAAKSPPACPNVVRHHRTSTFTNSRRSMILLRKRTARAGTLNSSSLALPSLGVSRSSRARSPPTRRLR